MIDDTLREKQEKKVERLFESLSNDKKLEMIKSVENALQEHLMQKAAWVIIDDSVVGGKNMFGEIFAPIVPHSEWRCEATYVIAQKVSEEGKPFARKVVLRVWEGQTCKVAIEMNKAMVARACSDCRTNFSTRMQSEVQTTATVMWLRLRGKFFCGTNREASNATMFFDDKKKVLHVMHSKEFKTWLLSHTCISPSKKDWDHMMSVIDAAAMNPEISPQVVPGALFDRRGDVIYISSGDSEMVKVEPSKDGTAITILPNGADGVVFTAGNTLAPWKFLKDEPGEDPFETCPPFSTANYQGEHGRMIARMWFLALPSCQRSKPAIVFTGKMRSGKSRTAKAVFELLGAPVRLARVKPESGGDKDFWATINKGGVVCFDNVDTKNTWFGDSMQLACTDGSYESRTLFSDDGVTTLQANAWIILTSNNPLFASESGLVDRLQIVRLGQFDGSNGKEVGDSKITQIIAERRDRALTWLARTVSKTLADKDPVEANVNMRHPDFADFVMRASRALGFYNESVLALKSAEFDKALLTIQNNAMMNYVFEAMTARFTDPQRKDSPWEGSVTELVKEITEIHKDLESSKRLTPTGLGRTLVRYIDQLAILFDVTSHKDRTGGMIYRFVGFSAAYAANLNISTEKTIVEEENENNKTIDELLEEC